MVSNVHRFLAGRTPGGPEAHGVWVLHGPAVQDIFFHDIYHGCTRIWHSLALWALHDWPAAADPDPPLVVVLKSRGDLDFQYNADRQEAEQRFNRSATPVKARASKDRSVESDRGAATGLIARLRQITEIFKNARAGRMLVMIDSLPYQLDQLKAHGKEAERNEALQIIGVDWHTIIDRARAMVVIVAPDRERLLRSSNLTQNQVDWEWTAVGGPAPTEIAEALLRSARRCGFALRQPEPVGEFLSHGGSLLDAMRESAAVVARGEEVTPATVKGVPPVDEDEVHRVLAELEAMVGLAEVKAKAADIVASARARRERLEAGAAFPRETMHMILAGGSGTGRTTVARLFARLYRALGLLSKGIRETSLAEGILDPNAGQTTLNMESAIEEAVGGVLFLVDAHTLSDPAHNAGNSWPAREALDALVPMAWNHRNNLVIILACDAAGEHELLEMNPVLPQRFPMPGRLEFTDYSPEQLWLISQRTLADQGWRLAPSAVPGMRQLLRHRAARPDFAHAHGVHELVSEVVKRHQARAGSRTGVLGAGDLPPVLIPRPDHLLRARRHLDALVGLAGVHAMLEEVTSQLRRLALQGDLGVPSVPGIVLVGPSGTGKATVASLVGELLYGHGLLGSSCCVSVTGSELTLADSGERRIGLHDVVARARGGVLLIDEAHIIGLEPADKLGNAVREQLLSEVLAPENRGTLFILAGHEGPINDLLARDPWLPRRFPTKLSFTNLTPRQCAALARRQLESGDYTCSEDFLKAFTVLAREAIASQGDGFGNAGWAQSQVADAVVRMNARVDARGAVYPEADRRRVIAADLVEAQRTYPAQRASDGRDAATLAGDPTASIPIGSTGDGDRPQLATYDAKMSHRTTATTRMHASSAHMIVQRSGDHGTIAATGFAVTTDGLFVTNAHVVEHATSIEVIIGRTGVTATGTSTHVAPDGIDLALVEVSIPAGVHVEPLPLGASTELEELTELLVLGHAQVRKGERPRMVKATVSRNDAENDQVHFEADGGIEEGFSGGPAVHLGSEAVVGVVSSGKGQTVKCIIRIEHVRSMLAALGYTFKEE